MPVTKTAKRALRSSKKKEDQNKKIFGQIDMAIRMAKRDKKERALSKVFSLVDRAAKKKILHPGKADRIKSRISKRLVHA